MIVRLDILVPRGSVVCIEQSPLIHGARATSHASVVQCDELRSSIDDTVTGALWVVGAMGGNRKLEKARWIIGELS